nr:2-succinyl-5-enolpyruvyl-6-hydroxy-3-cyclohexene-1-carboxylic-acid synthase [Acidobacteriota bacterium]
MTASADAAATFCATLVDEWIRLGARTAVLCPGSRSTPLALALASRAELAVHVFHDERSGSFAALGAALATGRPAILACTSGTAAVNFHPAVVEADHARVPMIVCTADRPPELQGVGAPQTIEQHGLFGASVRWEHDPGVPDASGSAQWREVASGAYRASVGPVPGPVHLNLPFREPLIGVAGPLPPARASGAGRLADAPGLGAEDAHELAAVAAHERGVILAGWGVDDPSAVTSLANRLGWPVLADPRSGISSDDGAVVVRHADPMLRHAPTASRLRPDAVLRLGDPPSSKVVNAWVAASGARIVAVSPSGRIVDPDRVVARTIAAQPSAVCASIATGAVDDGWLRGWAAASGAASRALDAALVATTGLSEPLVARTVAAGSPDGAIVVVSSSMPVRDLEWFGGATGAARILSNRGANGIDGVTSTAIGAALATGSTVVLLTGDVAFLHDSSALAGLVARDADLRIVVVDNGGGGIFSFLPQAAVLDGPTFERLFGTPHATDLVALARAHGIRSADASSADELRAVLAAPGPSVVRVRGDRAANVVEHDRLHAAVAEALS